jgi:hypothetical protein
MAAGAALAAAALTSFGAAGHAGHGKGPDHDHDERKGHGHAHGKEEPTPPTPEQIEKRLARVIRRAEARAKKREQRQRDRKRALGKRLGRRLRGADITPAIEDELKLHAQRVAKLRRIRYVAALEKDYEAVRAVDKLLARENARHERWWRSELGKERARAKEAKKGGKESSP